MAPLSLDDCRCPVCLEIFMEPVTLPCSHTFCKGCFLESVDKATLCCPLCRKRISSWARLNSRNNTLVDQQLWTQIQTRFPLLCQRRLNGHDAVTEDDTGVCFPRVCQPGELKQEYEDQVSRVGSWGQQPKQGNPDFPLPSYIVQLFQRDPEAFPGQPKDRSYRSKILIKLD